MLNKLSVYWVCDVCETDGVALWSWLGASPSSVWMMWCVNELLCIACMVEKKIPTPEGVRKLVTAYGLVAVEGWLSITRACA